ncbi:MAG TPA: prephenate dehydratase domain-containing protein [Planctomycetota bacterium]|nr:prephenate dehydratase domain-containing protein [Planctomycetota bacterium]
MDDIERTRQEINAIDEQILRALSARRELITSIIERKRKEGLPLRDPRREEDMLARLIDQGRALGLDAHFVTRVFHEVIDDSVRTQQLVLLRSGRSDARHQRVAFQGIYGAFSHLAAQKHFARSLDQTIFIGYPSFEEVISAVESGTVELAFLPIENTTAGSINEVSDLLAQAGSLYVIGEEVFRVEHCLLTIQDVPIESIRRVYSHPQAIKQCMKFLSTLGSCELVPYADTAMAARKIKEDQDPTAAAIASESAAGQYNLVILRRNLADQHENYTRFLVISREPIEIDARIPAKTSLVLAVPHEEGSLLKALLVFHNHKINLTKLDGSRPRPGAPFQYLFNVDFEGNAAAPNVRAALDELRNATSFLKILGSYPVEARGRTAPSMRALVPPRKTAQESGRLAETTGDEATSGGAASAAAAAKLWARKAKPSGSVVHLRSAKLGGDEFAVIVALGPIASREESLEYALQARDCGARALIAGLHRSRGSEAAARKYLEDLEAIVDAARQYDLAVLGHVGDPTEVDPVARRADGLVVGAGAMSNTALLEAVGKVNRPVVLERSAEAAVEDLLAASEVVLSHGNQQLLLCERGHAPTRPGTSGSLDLAAVPILKGLTHLPIVVNPCPAAVQRDWLVPLAQAARAVGSHGLVVEVHLVPAAGRPNGVLAFPEFADLMRALFASQ